MYCRRADSGLKYLRTCADVCPAGNESAEGGSGSGCGKISDRDHADDVYSGRCRSAERMGYIKTSADSDNCDLVLYPQL